MNMYVNETKISKNNIQLEVTLGITLVSFVKSTIMHCNVSYQNTL